MKSKHNDKVLVHLGELPDGTYPRYRFIELGDGRTGAMPDRLYIEVLTDDGRRVVIDATTTDEGIPEVRRVTIERTEGEPLDFPRDIGDRVLWGWVEEAARDTVAFSSMAYFGPETPDNLDPERAHREIGRRISTSRRPGKPPPDDAQVARVLKLRIEGKTYEEIAEIEQLSTSTVGRWVKRYGAAQEDDQ